MHGHTILKLIIDISHFFEYQFVIILTGALFVCLSVCLSFPFDANLKWQLFAAAPQYVQYKW